MVNWVHPICMIYDTSGEKFKCRSSMIPYLYPYELWIEWLPIYCFFFLPFLCKKDVEKCISTVSDLFYWPAIFFFKPYYAWRSINVLTTLVGGSHAWDIQTNKSKRQVIYPSFLKYSCEICLSPRLRWQLVIFMFYVNDPRSDNFVESFKSWALEYCRMSLVIGNLHSTCKSKTWHWYWLVPSMPKG